MSNNYLQQSETPVHKSVSDFDKCNSVFLLIPMVKCRLTSGCHFTFFYRM